MSILRLLIAEQDLATMEHLIEAGWKPVTPEDQPYRFELDLKAEIEADGFKFQDKPTFKVASGAVRYVKTYRIRNVECPAPPNVNNPGVIKAVRPYIWAAVRHFCKCHGVTHIHSVAVVRHDGYGLVSPNLEVYVRAYISKLDDFPQMCKETPPPWDAQESAEHQRRNEETLRKCVESIGKIKEAANLQGQGSLLDGIKEAAQKARDTINSGILPFNPKDLDIGNTWYYYMNGELIAHPVNYLTGQWLYSQMACELGADGICFIYAVDDKGKRLVKVDRPEVIDLRKQSWAFFVADASHDRPTYSDYLHEMHMLKVEEAEWRKAKKPAQGDAVKPKPTCKRCKSTCNDISSGLCITCIAQDANAAKVKLGQIEHVMSGHVQWIQSMQSIWKREEGQK